MSFVSFSHFVPIILLIVSVAARYYGGSSLSAQKFPRTQRTFPWIKGPVFNHLKNRNVDMEIYKRNMREELPFHLFLVGGRDAHFQEIPYILSFEDKRQFECGASYVKDRVYKVHFAITAAHCIKRKMKATVTAGILSHSTIGNKSHSQTLKVREIFMHPDYRPGPAGIPVNDIAILVLRGKFRETDYVKPISLPKFGNLHRSTLQVSGWGKLNPDDPWTGPVDRLQVTEIPVIGNIECNRMYRRKLQTTEKIILPTQICAGWPQGGMDTCSGDSGGPLTGWDPNAGGPVLVGVTSFGSGCGQPNLPGVYVRVSSYLAWITDVARKIALINKKLEIRN